MEIKRQIRLDLGEIKLDAEKTPEGYLKATAKVTRTGVFPYLDQQGNVQYELRHPDDVFSKASLDSLKGVPITLEHPKQMLNAANAKQLSIGHVGENIFVDSPFVVADLIITDAEAIRAIEAGKAELSCGYFLDLAAQDGVYEGQAYNFRQTNIRENHLAITDKARLGSALRIDSDVPYSVRTEARTDSNPNPEQKMIKVTINGVSYDCAPEVANELTRINSALETSKGEKAGVQAKLDTATGERDGFKTKLDEMEKAEPAKILAGAKARAALVLTASKALDSEAMKKIDSLSDLEIKKAVIMIKVPKGTSLDGQSEAYVQARFDIATENLDAENAEAALGTSRAAATPRHDGQDKTDPDTHRADMIERQKNGNQPVVKK